MVPKMGVLGIGLVMEDRGGARLVFRYPASPPPYFLVKKPSGSNRSSENTKSNSSASEFSPRESHTRSKNNQKDDINGNFNGTNSINLFFDLPARVLSKLFRPKRPLCGQPLTLNISGTTFCCRAELFDNLQSCPLAVGGDGNENPLVLFSIIVALAPLPTNRSTNDSVDDSTFTTIECIHRNLFRLCMVLTREERRSGYVTNQCQMLLTVRKEYEERFVSNSGRSVACDTNQSKAVKYDRVGETPGSKGKGAQTKLGDKQTVNQPLSGSSNTAGKATQENIYSSTNNEGDDSMSPADRRENIQQLIELMFASNLPGSNHGNLAQELAAVFHYFSVHDDPATPASATLSRDSRKDIYINGHLAVPFHSMNSVPTNPDQHLSTVNHVDETKTLLFPTLSPSEVVRALSEDSINLSISVGNSISVTDISATVSMSHAIRRMLTQLHPRKTLKEVAYDSALPINQVLEAATWLLNSKMCVCAMPVTRKSRYICVEGVVDKMRKLALPFWQAFHTKARHCKFRLGNDGKYTIVTGAPHIFIIVSALTSNTVTLGGVIDSLVRINEDRPDSDASFRWSVQSAMEKETKRFERPHSGGNLSSFTKREEPSSEDIIIYSMAVWLVANGVISPAD